MLSIAGTEGAEQSLARFSRRHAARGAGEKAHPQPRFHAAHREAERRLRSAQPCRRAGKTPLFGDGQKGRQVAQLLAPHS